MTVYRTVAALLFVITSLPAIAAPTFHRVVLGHFRTVPYSSADFQTGSSSRETELRVRPLLVDGQIKEWTSGSHHDVTDRSFVIQRAMRMNDALPTEKSDHWVWQLGPWLLVDRITGHISVLHLPDYDPAVSEIVWFRDYAAYCGLTTSTKHLEAVVNQIGGRRPILLKELKPWSLDSEQRACGSTTWQRTPLRVTFHPAGTEAVSFNLLGNSAILLTEEDGNSPQ